MVDFINRNGLEAVRGVLIWERVDQLMKNSKVQSGSYNCLLEQGSCNGEVSVEGGFTMPMFIESFATNPSSLPSSLPFPL